MLQDLKRLQEQQEHLICSLEDTPSANNMIASVLCLTVRFRSTQAGQSTKRVRHNIGSAFAFTRNHLFTTHQLLQELDPGFEIDSVWISDPADPLTKLGCKVTVLGSVEELDVAVLECNQIDMPDYELCHTPPHDPLVIYVAHRGESLTPEIRRGTAYPIRGPYEGFCCIRPIKRCTGAPVLDSQARVIGMLKSGASFATSDGLMHALKQIGMSLHGNDYAEIEELCSLWEFSKAVVEEEHAAAKLLRKRHAEIQGGRRIKKEKVSPPSGEGHDMKRAHEHGTEEPRKTRELFIDTDSLGSNSVEMGRSCACQDDGAAGFSTARADCTSKKAPTGSEQTNLLLPVCPENFIFPIAGGDQLRKKPGKRLCLHR